MRKLGLIRRNNIWLIILLAWMFQSCARTPQPSSPAGDLVNTVQQQGGSPEGDPSALPDLFPAAVTVKPAGASRQVQVHVSVRDRGVVGVASVFTVVWHPHVRSDIVGCRWDILPAQINHEKQELDCTFTYPVSGDMNWILEIDTEDDVIEADEKNNSRRGPITVASSGGRETLLPPSDCRFQTGPEPGVLAIAWEYAGPADLDGFVIYSGADRVVNWVAADTRTVVIPNLIPGKQYHFDVRAYKGSDLSPAEACSVDAAAGE